MSDKREDYLTWDEYFMGVAMLSGMRSKDPNTQVGCCIVSQDNKILSMGYNGFPKGCSDDEFPWAREGENPLETKYVYSTHSELNAILNYSGGSPEPSCMCHCFRVMSAQKRSFSRELKRSFMIVTSMRTPRVSWHPNG